MLISRDNLYNDLMIAYLDARKNKRNKNTQIEFELNLESNLYDLTDELFNRTYKPSPLICFMVEDKIKHTKREVFAPQFRDRVVSHLMFNYISPIFERTFIYDSYSCRKKKGTLFGINRLEHQIKSCSDNYKKETYVLSIDIKSYFMHIDKTILYNIVHTTLTKFRYRKINNVVLNDKLDFEFIYDIIKIILFRDPLKNCIILGNKKEWDNYPKDKSLFNALYGIGLTIGDLLSQLFSNIYLNQLDQYIKRILKCQYYGRYVDDAFIISNSKLLLNSYINLIDNFLNEYLHLNLSYKKIKITSVNHNIKFLGIVLRPYRRYVKNETIKKFRHDIYEIEKYLLNNKPNKEYIISNLSIINSYCGLLSDNKCYKILNKQFNNSMLNKYYIFDKFYHKAIKNKNIKYYV